MKKSVDFNKECSVFLNAITNENQKVNFCYERPRDTPDQVLTIEAKIIFNDIKAKIDNNIKELVSIYIARDEKQYKAMPQGRHIL